MNTMTLAAPPRPAYDDLPRLMSLMTGDEKHSAAATSTLDVLWVLYDRVLRVTPATEDDPARDRSYLSKGHGPAAYYAVLAAMGFLPEEWLARWGTFRSPLGHHPDRVLAIHGDGGYVRCGADCCWDLLPLPPSALDPGFDVATDPALRCPRCGALLRPHALFFDEYYTEPLYRSETALQAAKEAAQSVVLRVRQIAEVLMGVSVPDVPRVEAALAVLDGVAAYHGLDISGLNAELAYRQLQIAVARNDEATITARVDALRAIGGTFADSADRLLYRRCLKQWRDNPSDLSAASLDDVKEDR